MDSSPVKSNLACAWVGQRQLQLQQRPVKSLGDEDVLIKVMSTGLCGSDAHIWEKPSLSRQVVLGHEAAGIITAVGSRVEDRRVGQRVAIEPGIACLKCEFCLQGAGHHCENLKYAGVEPTDGMLCQYFICAAYMTRNIPDNVSWEEAAIVQPLAVAIQVARRGGIHARQTLAVFGCGPLGLLVIAVAKAYGVQKVVAFDIQESRVDFAVQYCADVGVTTSRKKPSEDAWTYAKDCMSSVSEKYQLEPGVDVAVEASGAEACTQMALALLKPGGTCVQAGLGGQLTPVPLAWLTAKELTIKGTARYSSGCFSEAIDLISRGKIRVESLITARYPLSNISEAFTALSERRGIKIVVQNQD